MADVGCPAQGIEGSRCRERSRGVEKAGSFAAETSAADGLNRSSCAESFLRPARWRSGWRKCTFAPQFTIQMARSRTALVDTAARFSFRGLRL